MMTLLTALQRYKSSAQLLIIKVAVETVDLDWYLGILKTTGCRRIFV